MSATVFTTLIFLCGMSLVSCESNVTLTVPLTTTTAPLKPESLRLMDVIKEDLRKNNDDYAEHRPRLGAPRSAYLNITMKPPTASSPGQQVPFQSRLQPKDTRRHYHSHKSHKADNMFANARLRARIQDMVDAANPEPVHKLKFQKLFNNNNYPKKYKLKDKQDKLKMFIRKNKGKLLEFANQKKSYTRIKELDSVSLESEDSSQTTKSAHTRKPFTLPNPFLLDMAPAQGGHIGALRIKGRLCYRNVMLPEGPKYDSKGNIYLKAHENDRKYRHNYTQTKPPTLVLPRCCNCCKKSVLGCE